MSRVQLALNVTDLSESVEFYRRLFGAGPAKLQPGYANFAIEDPPLKLVLFESETGGTINHLGIEVETSEEVRSSTIRLGEEGLTTRTEDGVDCCYARQDKVWVTDPDRAPWEVYTVLEHIEPATSPPDGRCC